MEIKYTGKTIKLDSSLRWNDKHTQNVIPAQAGIQKNSIDSTTRLIIQSPLFVGS